MKRMITTWSISLRRDRVSNPALYTYKEMTVHGSLKTSGAWVNPLLDTSRNKDLRDNHSIYSLYFNRRKISQTTL